jgi:RNA polymerase sigma-70 factor (ECF subfamily)
MDPREVVCEQDLIRRARTGDAEALHDLFERHRDVLEGRARRLMSPAIRRKVSIADVVQEARIAALDLAPRYEDRHAGGLRAWLLKIVELKAREAVRRYATTAKRAAGREVSQAGRPPDGDVHGRGPSPSQVAIASELKARAHDALRRLPDDYRRILEMTRIQGLTLAQAAERMGRSREAAKKLYGRAFLRFTAALDGADGEGDEPVGSDDA